MQSIKEFLFIPENETRFQSNNIMQFLYQQNINKVLRQLTVS